MALGVVARVFAGGYLAFACTMGVMAKDVEAPVPEFQLQSAAGPVALKDYRGKVVLVFFGYTHCPDVCPRSMENLTRVFNHLSKELLAASQGFFISVDPQRDTPKVLKEYTDYFHPKIMGLTGSDEALTKVAKSFGVEFKRVQTGPKPGDYGMDHPAFLYVIGKQGRMRFIFPPNLSYLAITQAIEYLVNEPQ